jgi:hypothetical protein
MPQKRETLTTRVTRLEELTEMLLAAQIKTEEQFQRTDERIEKLVIAIGELISRMPPPMIAHSARSGGEKVKIFIIASS